jgi:hypothetical protein
MDSYPVQQLPSQVLFSLTAAQPAVSAQREHQPMEDKVHPYFAASNLLIPPRSSTSRNKMISPLPAGPTTDAWSKMDTGLVSPPLSTTFFIPPSKSAEEPIHHATHGEQLGPNLVQRVEEEQEIQVDGKESAAGESVLIGSGTTVFGFSPLVNPDDQRANLKAREERILSDRHSRAMPLETLSRQAGVQQAGQAVDPAGIPHMRAGISPTLNLDQVEANPTVQPKEPSMEELVNSKDWSTTGLGPRSSWPVELSVLMPVIMRSASPLAIYWGDQSLLIYNDVSVSVASTIYIFFFEWLCWLSRLH